MTSAKQNLEELNKEALIELVNLLLGRVATLERQVEQLRSQMKDEKGVKKTSENSSRSPSQDQKANRAEKPRAKRGPKFGHTGKSRKRVAADEIIECRVEICEECGTSLEAAKQWLVGRHQVVDIPAIKPIVREARRYRVRCPHCKSEQTAEYVAGFEKGRMFGSNLESLALYLHYAHPLGYARVQRVLKDICGLTISSGAVVNMAKRAQGAVEQAAEDIRTQIRGAAVVGSDETSARVDGVTYWQWVFQTPEWVYNVIQATRSAQVIADVMDDAQPQVWVSDLFSSQLLNPATDYQICLAHQVRDLQYAIDTQQCQWAEDVQNLLHKSMALNQQRASYAAHAFAKQVRDCESQLDQLLDVYPNNSDGERLRHRFVKHRQAILLFLHRDDVPPTNNASEQALRNSVIYRKVTGGFRSDWGAQLYANVISILETARRQGRDIFQTLVDILHGRIVFPPPVSA